MPKQKNYIVIHLLDARPVSRWDFGEDLEKAKQVFRDMTTWSELLFGIHLFEIREEFTRECLARDQVITLKLHNYTAEEVRLLRQLFVKCERVVGRNCKEQPTCEECPNRHICQDFDKAIDYLDGYLEGSAKR